MTSNPREVRAPPTSVLVVEDDPDIRAALCDFLDHQGYRVASAWNGRDALETLEQGFRPDVILLDLMMPVMSGPDFRAAQLADPALASIPVVVLTASNPCHEWVRTLDVAAAFGKPFDTEAVVSVIDRLAQTGRRGYGDPPAALARTAPAASPLRESVPGP